MHNEGHCYNVSGANADNEDSCLHTHSEVYFDSEPQSLGFDYPCDHAQHHTSAKNSRSDYSQPYCKTDMTYRNCAYEHNGLLFFVSAKCVHKTSQRRWKRAKPSPRSILPLTMVSPTIPSRYKLLQNLKDDRPYLGLNNAGIYLVQDRFTGSQLVEKRLRSADVRDGFARREIDLLYQLRGHPNIAQLEHYELYASKRFKYPFATVWTEYCRGGSIADLIEQMMARKEYIDESLCWNVLESLIEAVDFCQAGNGDGRYCYWDYG